MQKDERKISIKKKTMCYSSILCTTEEVMYIVYFKTKITRFNIQSFFYVIIMCNIVVMGKFQSLFLYLLEVTSMRLTVFSIEFYHSSRLARLSFFPTTTKRNKSTTTSIRFSSVRTQRVSTLENFFLLNTTSLNRRINEQKNKN